jgi:hypothetical protein
MAAQRTNSSALRNGGSLSGEFGQAPRAEPRFVLRLFGLQIPGNQRPVRHVLLA